METIRSMNSIKELTEQQSKEILQYVFPKEDYTYLSTPQEIKPNEDGSITVTMDLRPIVGIQYHNGQDRCLLSFDNTKVISWLYKNGFEIGPLLEVNEYLSDIEYDLEELCFRLYYTINHSELKKEEVTEWINKYFYDTDY